MAVMLPHLLDASYNEVSRLRPEKLSVKINQTPLSTASMTLPEGEPTISIRQWMELYGPHGSLGKFRVSKVKTNYGDSQVISLEHGITTLGDYLTAADTTLTGTPYSIMGTLLGYQSLWTRGTIPNTGSYTVKVDRSNVLSAVLDLLKQMTGYMLTYDFTTWTVGIALMESTPSCECRMRRNVENVRIIMDDNDLCTRVYAVGLTGGYMDADTVSTWGVIAKSLGTPDDADPSEVQAYATQYLAEYKNPRVSIEISAQELSEKTGEPLDSFGAGKLCRVALPDWGYTTDQRIVTVNYSDLLGDPDNVQLSLSTSPRDLSDTLAGISTDLYGTSTATGGGSGGGGGGASGKGKLVEYRTAINRNTDSVEILAWDVSDLNSDLVTAQAAITVNAQQVALKASQYDVDALGNRVTSAESSITVNADNIALKVSKNGVVSSINQTPESITISASRIDLSGYVTASQLSAAFADFTGATIDFLSVNILGVTTGAFESLTANSMLRYGTDTIGKSTKTVMTGATLTVNSTGGYVTSVKINKSYETLDYLSY